MTGLRPVLPGGLILLFLVLGNVKPGVAASADLITLRYAQAYSAMRSIFSLPVSVASRQGFFSREGIDLKVIVPTPGGSDKMIDALHDDTADLTHVATPFLIRAALAGSDAVAIAAEFQNPIYSLIAKPEIQNFGALKGKVIGFADESGSITISMRRLLTLHGVRERDVRVKIIEGTPARSTCLKRGECAAVPLGQPQDIQAINEGYRLLGFSTEAVRELLYTVTAVRRSWAEAHSDAIVRYVRGLSTAFKFIRDPVNRSAVVKIIVETTGTSESVARQTLDLYLEPDRKVLPRRGELDVNGMSRIIALLADSGAVKAPVPPAERFLDLRYLRSAGIQ